MSPLFINLEDLYDFEQDPVRKTVREEVEQQSAVGNGEFGQHPSEERFQDPEALASQLGSVFDLVQPRSEVDELSEEEEQELTQLEQRSQRLQPVQQTTEPISRRIQGNPFSIEVGPGLRQAAIAALNVERRRRREGAPEVVDRVDRRVQNLQERNNQIARQIAETDDPQEQRRLERQQDRVRRQMSRANRRRQRVSERYRGFEGRLGDLQEQQQEAQIAEERNVQRQQARQEFITENVGEAVQENVQQVGEMQQENLESFNKYQLQERLFELKTNLEQTKGSLGSPEGRREYASTVNQYARTFLQTADTYENDIKAIRDMVENLALQPARWYYTAEEAEAGEVPEGTPDELIAPEGKTRTSGEVGDPQYLQLQSQIESLRTEKQRVLDQALKIYENSTVLGEGTRALRPPTEADKEKVQQMREHGFSQQQIETFARGLGFDPEELELDDTPQPEEQPTTEESQQVDLSQFETIGDVAERYGITEEDLVQQVMQQNNLSSPEEARRLMERQLQQARGSQ